MGKVSLMVLLLVAPIMIRAEDKPPALSPEEQADIAALSRAWKHFEENRFDKARDELLALIGTGRKNSHVARGRLLLADVLESLGDEKALLKLLRDMTDDSPMATERGIMDTSDTRQEAIKRLGRYYLRKGDYKTAHQSFARWQPSSWCGTCLMGMMAERHRALLFCRLHLGEQAAVARELLHAVKDAEDTEPTVAILLFQLYRDAGQMDDLIVLLGRSEKVKKNKTLQHLLDVEQLAAKKDVAGLLQLCQSEWVSTNIEHHSPRDWHGRAAADALLGCLGKDVAPILRAMKAEDRPQHWLIYALGQSGSPKALEWLVERARKDISGHHMDNITYAISLHGEEGKKALTTLVKEMTNHVAVAAQRRLESLPRPDPFARPWPAPKAGSLPRS